MDLLTKIKRNWHILLQGGIWIMVLLSSFILAPPIWDVGDYEGGTNWFKFSQFAVSTILGLLVIPLRLWSNKTYVWHWWSSALITLLLSVSLFFFYNEKRIDWTVPYSNTRIVIGMTILPKAKEYIDEIELKEKRVLSSQELVWDYSGRTMEIWPSNEIHLRIKKLVGLYLSTLLMFSLMMITLVQAIYCQSNKSEV